MRRRIRKGLAMLLTATMVVGLMPGAGTIKVSAAEGEASGSVATAEGYDENGFCTSYELTNGTWALKSGVTACATHGETCNGYQPAVEELLDYDINGDGNVDTDDKAYKITNAGQLYWFADKVNNDYENYKDKNAVLTTNITVNEGVLSDGALNESNKDKFRSWTPIGYWDLDTKVQYPFSGIFDGAGNKINGLYFKDDSKIRVGLFGLNGGTIKNVNIADSYFCGRNAVGGVCGQNYSGNIETCNNINSFVSGNGTVGGVCGNNYSGTITDCNNTGEVQGSINVGGVCGFNYQGSVKNCSNSGNVIGTGADKHGGVGGVCGESDGSLETSYNTGDVKGVYYVGGVCGYQSGGSVDSCYNTENVTGTSTGASVGGVCGVQSTNGLTSNCYSTGSVICTASDTTNTYVGGVYGFQRGAIKNCYYDNGKFTGKAIDYSASDTSQSVYVEGKTFQLFSNGGVAYLLNSRAAEGSPVWYQNIDNGLENDAVPVLDSSHGIVYASKPCPVIGSNNENTVSTESKAHSFDNSNICSVCGKKGDVIDDPAIRDHKPTQEGEVYQITSKEELYYFVALVNGRLPDGTQDASASAVLKNDIVVNENLLEKLNEDGTVKDDNTVDSWVAIGYDGIKTYEYTGTFDGGGHKISGLYLDSENYNIGLFGVSSGTIKNVTVEECYFKGKDKVGAVCGYNKGLIENCKAVNGSVCALIFEGTVGGICGSNDSSITNCSTQVTVGCSFNCTRLGGICGSNNATGTISKCYSLGSVKNTYEQVYYGGVCGINSGKISDCYNETAIKNVGKGATFGGICGKNDGEIITSYNTGEISYKDDNGSLSVAKYGGICGWSNKTISDCYNSGYVEVNASSWRHGGGICGYNYGQIKNCYNGSNSGRISGYGGGTYINCYYLSNSSDTSGKTSAQFASGEVAYLLNEGKTDSNVVWRQTLTGEIDTTPVLDSTHSIVYASKPCESEFANTEFEGEKQHNYQISTNGAYHQCSYCKKTEQHADVATFTVDDENHSITATCPSCGNLGTITLSASDATYDGADKAASISGEIKGFDTPSIVYKKKAENGSFETINTTPKDAGTYRASITYTVDEANNKVYSVSVT